MIIELCNNPESWDAYVDRNPHASTYHNWVWRDIIHETFGHQPYYLTAIANGRIRGVLPLVSIQSRIFGDFLVSIPFFTNGGLLADSEEARSKLLAKAADLADDLGADHIELRQGRELAVAWKSSTAKVTMEIPLPKTADDYWKQLSSGMRNKIRAAKKHGLRVQWGGIESVEAFYPIFATNMRNLGTPVYPRLWFENQCRALPENIRILTLWDGNEAVAGAFLTSFRKTLELPWSASLPESRKKYSQVLLYWTFLEKAIQDGYELMDLGRCTQGSGTYEFKRHWNSVERPLHWYYWLAPGKSIPHLRPDNMKYRFAVEFWKRLPLQVANGLGPRVVRSIP
jgi:FemAB-related protein (PEP-CTERM system-associated)